MPTIEIVCLGQKEPVKFPDLLLALEAENEAISHRSLFYGEFKELKGCIYHLGNPYLRDKDGWFYAQQLLHWPDDRLQFRSEFAVEVQQMFLALLKDSPVHQIIFSSDYQFGPEQTRRYQQPLRLETFWRKHDAGKLWLNARYFVQP